MKNIYKSNKIVALCLLATLITVAGYSAAPSQINYQGRLLDGQGVPIDGEVKVVNFGFFRDEAKSTNLNLSPPINTQYSVTPVKGFFSIAVDVKPEWFVGGNVYMEVSVDGNPLGSPQQLVSSPYAIAVSTGSVGVDELKDGAVNLTKIDSNALKKVYITADGRLVIGEKVKIGLEEKLGYYSAVCRNGTSRYMNCEGECPDNPTDDPMPCGFKDSQWIGFLLLR